MAIFLTVCAHAISRIKGKREECCGGYSILERHRLLLEPFDRRCDGVFISIILLQLEQIGMATCREFGKPPCRQKQESPGQNLSNQFRR